MKCALITGASRGIGRAIAIQIAKDLGFHILINYASNEEAAKETLQLIKSEGGSGELIPFSVENGEEVQKKMQDWFNNNPEKEITVLVNNAGITKDNLFLLMPEEDWDKVIQVSVKGMYNCTQAILPKMVRKRYGRIINMASVSGVKGNAGQANYAAAKGAVISASKSLAQELARRNITVNCVAPGFIKSDMTSHLNEKELAPIVPVNRFGLPEEVAYLVSFLASDKAAYITGEVININGGIYA
ncbi:MAG: 3-oxoacyl-ACP reductase FabG [Flavobacteriia bacterium]|nr:3-oxoacyl-ACP reductase FabG [Flavobacteriia bacterium]